MSYPIQQALKSVENIERDILSCESNMLKMINNHVENIKTMFNDPMERSIALLLHNAFMYYTWTETKEAFKKSIDSFLASTIGKSVVFLFHSETSSASSQNNCHQKSSFFFTFLALKISKELSNKTIGFVCNDLSTVNLEKLKNGNNTVFCICEDSIYSGNQITKVIRELEVENKIDLTKLHIISPFVRERFIEQSSSKPYSLHTHVWVPSLADRLTDEDVISDTCQQIKKLRLSDGESSFSEINACKDGVGMKSILNIFPQRNKHSPVFFSHKIADSVSLPLPWLLGILGLGVFMTREEYSWIANEHVKTTKGGVWSCIRGPYKTHSGELLELFESIFSNPKTKTKTSLFSRFTRKKIVPF